MFKPSPMNAALVAGLALAAVVGAACSEEQDSSSAVADSSPLSRMTAEQYRNTVRDLFPGAEIRHLYFPVELEGRGGFENNVIRNTATPGLVEAYQVAATQVAEDVSEDLTEVVGCDVATQDCGRTWVEGLAERAWRRPLSEAESTALLERYDAWQSESGNEVAVQLTITYLLQSADFIYFPRLSDAPAEGENAIPLSDYELATRLSYFLWNSTPDQELLDLARDGKLQDRAVLAEQATRMLSDWRAVDMVVSFHRQTWDFDDVGANPIDLDFYAPVFNDHGMFEEDDKSDFYYLEY